ncbi:hypothetical protein [Murinocardiopsis flavida]|nr:hypothetical protein [Murinocardiopsis flavida]
MSSARMIRCAAAVLAAAALTGSTPAAARAAGPAPPPGAWTGMDLGRAELSGAALHHDGIGAVPPDGSGAAGSARAAGGGGAPGLATFAAHRIDRATDTVAVAAEGTADPAVRAVEARGLRHDGVWTEWHAWQQSGAESRVVLPAPVRRVQVRAVLAADPGARLSGVRLRPLAAGTDRRARPGTPFSARVFATRIGLVGDRTANGDTIRPADHFVALPSRRGLATKGTGDYTVRVCAEGSGKTPGRCAYAPVWDVGPWNIKDDYWNEDRQMWTDLARGTPQAQAGHQDGHNKGRDGFGRRIANPAGIDLADGTFDDALKLATNAWVRVDYLWTGGYAHQARIKAAKVRGTVPLRAEPSSGAAERGLAAHTASVDVRCAVTGDAVTGPGGTGDRWYRIGAHDFVPAVNAEGGEGAPDCGAEPSAAPAPTAPPAPTASPTAVPTPSGSPTPSARPVP